MSFRRLSYIGIMVLLATLAGASRIVGQAPDSVPADSTQSVAATEPAPVVLPVYLTLGLGYGQRSDACAYCTSPENTESFTAHLSVGKRLPQGMGIGLDASVWQRGHPGPLVADSTAGEGGVTAASLTNRLANLSLVFSYQAWHVFVRGGAGIAMGWQDIDETDSGGTSSIVTASGKGIGFTAGGGITIPVHTMVSVAIFANWNRGTYDLTSPRGVLQRGAQHEYTEVGFGVSLR